MRKRQLAPVRVHFLKDNLGFHLADDQAVALWIQLDCLNDAGLGGAVDRDHLIGLQVLLLRSDDLGTAGWCSRVLLMLLSLLFDSVHAQFTLNFQLLPLLIDLLSHLLRFLLFCINSSDLFNGLG